MHKLLVRNSSFFFNSILLFLFLLTSPGCANSSGSSSSLTLSQTIPLPGIHGRIDHMCYDADSGRLFIVSPGCNSFAEVNLKTGKEVFTSNLFLSEPQGIIYLKRWNLLFISNGGDGTCRIFNAHSHLLVQTIELGDDADNIRYRPAVGEIYVAYGNGGIAVFNDNDLSKIADYKFKGHPESFQIDTISEKIFVNVPDRDAVVVIDLKNKKIESEWKINNGGGNFPMGIDIKNKLLFIGCRSNSKMAVFDYLSGKEKTRIDIGTDADDIFYDDATHKIYVSCGGGEEFIFLESDQRKVSQLDKIKTGVGARTCLLLPGMHLLIVAKPGHLGNEGSLLIYKTN